jgi:hypothetical protein
MVFVMIIPLKLLFIMVLFRIFNVCIFEIKFYLILLNFLKY